MGVEDRAVREWARPSPCAAGTERNRASGPCRDLFCDRNTAPRRVHPAGGHMASASGDRESKPGHPDGAGLRPCSPSDYT